MPTNDVNDMGIHPSQQGDASKLQWDIAGMKRNLTAPYPENKSQWIDSNIKARKDRLLREGKLINTKVYQDRPSIEVKRMNTKIHQDQQPQNFTHINTPFQNIWKS